MLLALPDIIVGVVVLWLWLLLVRLVKRNRLRVCIGHYPQLGFRDPGGKNGSANETAVTPAAPVEGAATATAPTTTTTSFASRAFQALVPTGMSGGADADSRGSTSSSSGTCVLRTVQLMDTSMVLGGLAPSALLGTDREGEEDSAGAVATPGASAIVECMLPHPIRFQEVWRMVINNGGSARSSASETSSGASPTQNKELPAACTILHVWRGVPPSNAFVCMGMIASRSTVAMQQGSEAAANIDLDADVAPALSSLRCVPRSWVRPSTVQPQRVWQSDGLGGQAGALWAVSSLQLLVAISGSGVATTNDKIEHEPTGEDR
jgi:hypothetical protein